MDDQKKFYYALGGGQEHKPYGGLASFLAALANPWSKNRFKRHGAQASKAGVEQNFTGEGFVAGGVYVMRPDGKASYAFLEEDLGDRAPIEDVIQAVKAAKQGEDFMTAAPEGTNGERR